MELVFGQHLQPPMVGHVASELVKYIGDGNESAVPSLPVIPDDGSLEAKFCANMDFFVPFQEGFMLIDTEPKGFGLGIRIAADAFPKVPVFLCAAIAIKADEAAYFAMHLIMKCEGQRTPLPYKTDWFIVMPDGTLAWELLTITAICNMPTLCPRESAENYRARLFAYMTASN